MHFSKTPLDDPVVLKTSGKAAENVPCLSKDRSNTQDTQSTTTKENKWKCKECSLSLPSRTHLITHMRTHTGEKPFVCHICSKEFKRVHDLQVHIHTHTGVQPYGCAYCSERFNHKSNYRRHIKRFHDQPDRPKLVCQACGEEFCRKKSLEEHMRVKHEGERQFYCELCRRRFMRSYDYKIHLRVHAGEKPYTCEICVKSFRQKSIYTKHMKSHEDC